MVGVIIWSENSATIAVSGFTSVVLCAGTTVTVGFPSGFVRAPGRVPMAQPGPLPTKATARLMLASAAPTHAMMAPEVSGMTL